MTDDLPPPEPVPSNLAPVLFAPSEIPRVRTPEEWDAIPYDVTITKPGRFRYEIEIGHDLLEIGRYFMGVNMGWAAWTRRGAERKAQRIIAKDRRERRRRTPIKEYQA